MTDNKYKYGLIDLSYLLQRNCFACSKKNPKFTPGDVLKLTIQTLNKIPRDYGITVDKYIFVRDTWSKQYKGYFRTEILKGLYKDSRFFWTKDKLEELKRDPEATQEQIAEAEQKVYENEVRNKTKWELIREFGKFGVPTISVEGWEYDDLAFLAGMVLWKDPDPKKSVIITKDSDLQYSLTPKLDYFRIPTAGSIPQVITYDEMYETLPEDLKGKCSLYDYKAIHDAIGCGHNDMRVTKKRGANDEDTIVKCFYRDYSNIEDRETYDKQLQSFDITCFPNYWEANTLVSTKLDKVGSLCDLKEFRTFCEKDEVFGITDRYFNEFVARFDPNLYKNE